jgi:hypothetical protein
MTRRQYDDEGDDIIKDGEHVRVPMMLCDGFQRDVAQHYARPVHVVDAFGMSAGRKRGYCFPNTSSGELRDAAIDARDQADQAYADLVNRDQNAWRRNVNVADKEEAEEAAKLSPTDARDSAFAELEKRSANAWRGGR